VIFGDFRCFFYSMSKSRSSLSRNRLSSVVQQISSSSSSLSSSLTANASCGNRSKEIHPNERTVRRSTFTVTNFEETCLQIMMNDNQFLLSGFREETMLSLKKCLGSLFTLHNDTMNIWTHLFGAILQIYLMRSLVFGPQALMYTSPFEDRIVLVVYLALCFSCFFLSATYHLFRTYSVHAYVLTLILDLIGITLQIFGGIALFTYGELCCFPIHRKIFLSLETLLLLMTIFSIPKLVILRRTTIRTFLLGFLSAVALLAWLEHWWLSGRTLNNYNIFTLIHLLKAYGWIIGGLCVRSLKVPECLAPGKFDVWFSSHQIFHVMGILAAHALTENFVFLREMGIANTCGQNIYFY